MAKLTTVASVISRGKLLDTNPDVVARVSDALDATSVYLADELRTAFNADDRIDQFWVSSQEKPWAGDFIRLALSNGFVDPDTVVVRSNWTLTGIATAVALEADSYKVDAEKGTVLVLDSGNTFSALRSQVADKMFFQVEYSSGFSETTTTEDGAVYTDVPGWLTELAITTALEVYRGGADCEDKPCDCLSSKTRLLIERHLRWFPSAVSPLV